MTNTAHVSMSSVADHISLHSHLVFEIPQRLKISDFFARIFFNWYAKRLEILRVELLGVISILEKKEVIPDQNSYFLFLKVFNMIYSFQKTVESKKGPQYYSLKISLSKTFDTFKQLLSIYERHFSGEDNFPILIAETDLSDWQSEKV